MEGELGRVELEVCNVSGMKLSKSKRPSMSGDGLGIVVSPLSRSYADDGLTVDVQIYKLGNARGWTLEVAVSEEVSLVWADTFQTDTDAWKEFIEGAVAIGLRRLLGSNGDEVLTIH